MIARKEGLIVNKMLTTREVADLLDLSEETVLRKIRAGELKAYLPSRRSGYRIRQEDLDAFMAARIAVPA